MHCPCLTPARRARPGGVLLEAPAATVGDVGQVRAQQHSPHLRPVLGGAPAQPSAPAGLRAQDAQDLAASTITLYPSDAAERRIDRLIAISSDYICYAVKGAPAPPRSPSGWPRARSP